MNKKIMIIGAGAALLLGSVAIAQTTSSTTDQSQTNGSYQAPAATDNSANTSATTPDNSANTAGSNASATAGERG